MPRSAACPFEDDLSPAPSETWWDIYQENRALEIAPQVFGWTCSICSTDWLLRATGLDPQSCREKVAYDLGYPDCVDQYSGLKNTQCIVRLLEEYGVTAKQEWVSWDSAQQLASSTAYILNSTSWYHFVGGRGVTESGDLWIANSALGYRSVYETISRSQFDSMPPWQMVYLLR